MVRWLRGHSSPLVSGGWDFITGKDYIGKEMSGFAGLGSSLQPVGFSGETPLERGLNVVGLTAFPVGARQFETRRFQEEAGKPLTELSYSERLRTGRKVGRG